MFRLSSVLIPFVLVQGLTACGRDVPNQVTERYWPDREVVYRLDAAQGTLSAYSVRNGITPLGVLRLPPGYADAQMKLDTVTGRVSLSSAAGVVVADGRALKLLGQYPRDLAEGPVDGAGEEAGSH